jgi:hypothetical protein
MTTLTSTVPGAIAVLLGYMGQVATDNPDLDAKAYLGPPVERVTDNYLMIGDETGHLITGYRQNWVGMPASAERKSEEYGIVCSLRAWTGGAAALDPAARLTDAFTMIDGLMGLLQADPGASGSLTPSGSWQVPTVDIPVFGPFESGGWGALVSFTVQIINVRLTS